MKSIQNTDFQFTGQTKSYHGKVRDMYTIGDELMVAVVSDRISAFDVVMPRGIPFKGQVLNGVASHFLDAVTDIVPTWKLATPDPNVTVGLKCEPIRLEMVIRGYLTGHAWRQYKAGHRTLCGATMPDGMREHDRFPHPIITPATKAEEGHDEDISPADILARGIVSPELWAELERVTRALFQRGTAMAAAQGLILVDTKYEFGLRNGTLTLIDEIHTPDSSRYFYADGYEERQAAGQPQKQLSKEFVREWLMERDFMGLEGQTPPVMDDEFLDTVTTRYIELYEKVTGLPFEGRQSEDPLARVEEAVEQWLHVHQGQTTNPNLSH
ncbi:MAG: phosphoribosylaminoimidazolesuccinocarboxamide synthase [Bacteroidetes bacterium]|nr:phosphoribosylaminoimidazolesuccinocarboxamide synthase [Bacteroidota bacterium]MDA0903024.1 phosphoribosylaminoimidazolesuccinocarboxamide synthase [Bacteroidota bacterium]MDA1241766.1 phosphoribosylaminoimidazolesuccinocarboxamide synthase [Bacteroidota bacterium]